MTDFRPGQPVLAQNAFGAWLPKRAVSAIERDGHSFPVVWVCAPEDWHKPPGQRPRVPWPAEYVKPAD